MPKKAEEGFKKGARAHGYKPGTPAYNRYVFGGMSNAGLLDRPKKTARLRKAARSVKRKRR